MQDIYQTFEFYKIKNQIKDFSKSELGKIYIDNLTMFNSKEEVKNALLDLDEMMSLYTRFGALPIHSSGNALTLIDIAKKTGLLSPRDLNLIADDVLTMNAVNKHLNQLGESYPRINSFKDKFIDLSMLEKEIHRVINNTLNVDDKASEKLHELRNKIRKLNSEVEKKAASLAYTYSAYLSETNPTIRDGHFVLPVKTNDKSKVVGAIYDVSSSGNTTFIEPLEIISLNNEITALKVEENEEIRRILKALTSLVLIQENEVLNNNKIIAELDFLQSKAIYAITTSSVIASIKEEPYLDIKDARHPLIDSSRVVANSYHLDKDKRIVIISGPNAGGKTVSLKVIGLLSLMNQSGLAIPAIKAELSYFNHIYIDIGDNQSLSDNLSTFSAHMSSIGEICKVSKEKDLILLDELGTGTDPKEGEAIAISVVNHLLKSNCLGMISSHFSSLKELALVNSNLDNSSMIFDEEKLSPTYVFKQGIPGRSYGIEVASRYGVGSNIIDNAKEYIKTNSNVESEKLIKILQTKVDESNKLLDSLSIEKAKLEIEKKTLLNDQKLIEERRKNLLKNVSEEKENLINDTKSQLDDIIKALNNKYIKLHEIIELKKKVESLEESEEIELFNENILVNDFVSIPSLGLSGRVDRIKGKKAHIISETGLGLDVDISRLKKEVKSIKPSVNKISKPIELDTKVIPLELNLIGLHVDEAKEKLMMYLDNARYKHFTKVRIIHGFGSGALRKMTHEYLSTQKDLSFKLADGIEGGGGATVVTFNDRKN